MHEPVRVVIIAGIRPQFIKMAAFLHNMRKYNRTSHLQMCASCINTGQHYDRPMSTQLFHQLGLSFDFAISHSNPDPDAILANTLVELSRYLKELFPSPDWVIVFGDGNPSMAGAVAAARQGYKLVHIEAGERRGKYEHEEINRRIVDTLSDVHFCVSRRAVSFLANHGISTNVYWTGDLAYDFTLERANDLAPGIHGKEQEGYILTTIHRPENLEAEVLKNIVTVLSETSRRVYFLCHPRTRARLQELELWTNEHIEYLSPLPYLETLAAIRGCSYLFTDSGGIVREASHLGKRCVVRRNSGAWPDLISRRFNVRAGKSLPELRDSLANMEVLLKQKVRLPEILYRSNGVQDAFETLSKLARNGT